MAELSLAWYSARKQIVLKWKWRSVELIHAPLVNLNISNESLTEITV